MNDSSLSHPGHLSPLLKQSSAITVERGEGVYLYGRDGERYLDFTAGIGVTSTGHCHPKVVEAVREQVGKLIHGQYAIVRHGPLDALTERLGERMPGAIDSLFYANAGTEAVEAALRLARQATGPPNMIVFHGGFLPPPPAAAPAGRRRVGVASRAYAEHVHDLERVPDRLLDLYARL